jgi:hypothetical protein
MKDLSIEAKVAIGIAISLVALTGVGADCAESASI